VFKALWKQFSTRYFVTMPKGSASRLAPLTIKEHVVLFFMAFLPLNNNAVGSSSLSTLLEVENAQHWGMVSS